MNQTRTFRCAWRSTFGNRQKNFSTKLKLLPHAAVMLCLPFLSSCKTRAYLDTKPLLNAQSESTASDGQVDINVALLELQRTIAALTMPGETSENKSMAIDRTFKAFNLLCEQNCAQAVEVLSHLNQEANSSEFNLLVQDYLNPTAQALGVQNLDLKPIQMGLDRIAVYFEKRGPDALTIRAKATIELVRLLVKINEDTIIAMSEAATNRDLTSILNNETVKSNFLPLIKQARAVATIAQVLEKFRKSEKENATFTEDDARLVANAIYDLGFFYAKFAQSLSNLSVGISSDDGIVSHFQRFQENLEPMSWQVARSTLKEQLGRNPEEIFIIDDLTAGKEPKQIATATIAQTYKWKLSTPLRGTHEVIVKVQRPGRREELQKAAQLNRVLIEMKNIAVGGEPYAPLLDFLAQLLIGFEDSVERELDFRLEAKNLLKARAFFATQPGITVPNPVDSLTREKVLVMEVAPGTNIEKIIRNKDSSFLPGAKEAAFAALLDTVLYQYFWLKWAHGDMHPGNILANEKGQVSLIDLANVFSTKGLVWEPTGIFVSLLLGNPEGVAAGLERIQRGTGFQKLEFTEHLREVLKEAKIEKVSINIPKRQFDLKGLKNLHKRFDQDPEFLMTFLGTAASTIQAAQSQFNWLPTERFADFGRSAAPMMSTLITLSKEIPTPVMTKIFRERALRLIPAWTLRSMAGTLIERMDQVRRPFYNFLDDRLLEAEQKILQRQRGTPQTQASGDLDIDLNLQAGTTE